MSDPIIQSTPPAIVPAPMVLPPAAAVLMPAIDAKLDQLAVMPPGAEAQTQKVETSALIGAAIQAIQAAAANPALQAAAGSFLARFSAKWQFWIVLIGGLVLTNIGSFSTGRYVVPSIGPQPPANVAPPPVVVEPKPAVAVAPKRLVIYPVVGQDTATLLSDAALHKLPLAIEVKAPNPPGSHMPWKGKDIPLPCAVLMTDDGHVLDVSPFATGADLAAWAATKK